MRFSQSDALRFEVRFDNPQAVAQSFRSLLVCEDDGLGENPAAVLPKALVRAWVLGEPEARSNAARKRGNIGVEKRGDRWIKPRDRIPDAVPICFAEVEHSCIGARVRRGVI